MRSLTLAALAGLLALTLSAALPSEARADHKRHWHGHHWQGHHWGPSWHHRHGWKRNRGVGVGASIVFGAPRRVYVERRPRVIYVDPDPVIVQSPGYVEARPQPRYVEPRYAEDDGRYCREVNKTVVIDGEPQNAYGKACYQPDGSWQWVLD